MIIHSHPAPLQGLASLIASIGKATFDQELISYLSGPCAAEHCSVLTYDSQGAKPVLTVSSDGTNSARKSIDIYLKNRFASRDQTLLQAQRRYDGKEPVLLKMEVETIPDEDFRDTMYRRTNICERVLIYGGSSEQGVGISVLRSHKTGPFSDDALSWLHSMSTVLMSAVAKHAEMSAASTGASLASLADIEKRIACSQVHLPPRERQVCARLLFGMGMAAIASELGVGEESVETYRKRAFQRLELDGRHQLMVWYLKLCDEARMQ